MGARNKTFKEPLITPEAHQGNREGPYVCQSMRYPRARATSAPSTALPITLILSPVPGLAAAHAPHPHLRAPPITLILSPVPGLAAAYAPHPHLRAPPRGAFTALKCTSKTLILSPVPDPWPHTTTHYTHIAKSPRTLEHSHSRSCHAGTHHTHCSSTDHTHTCMIAHAGATHDRQSGDGGCERPHTPSSSLVPGLAAARAGATRAVPSRQHAIANSN